VGINLFTVKSLLLSYVLCFCRRLIHYACSHLIYWMKDSLRALRVKSPWTLRSAYFADVYWHAKFKGLHISRLRNSQSHHVGDIEVKKIKII
jgi:hypothetical protein